jgi:putative thioredoxin
MGLRAYEDEMATTNDTAGTTANIIDVTEATFQAEVLDRSLTTPVVIDFWAAWCTPCHQLSPILEKAIAARNGKVVLAKIDVDSNPRLATALGVQSIPAVKAVVGGRLVAEFVGVQPPAAVEQFLDSFVPKGDEGRSEPAQPEPPVALTDEAIASWRETLAGDPDNVDARVGLARFELSTGDHAEALELLHPVEHLPEAAPVLAEAHLAAAAAGDDPELAAAAAKARQGDAEEALEALLGIVRASDGERRDRARSLMVDVFRLLGDEDPVSKRYRRGLMTALY